MFAFVVSDIRVCCCVCISIFFPDFLAFNFWCFGSVYLDRIVCGGHCPTIFDFLDANSTTSVCVMTSSPSSTTHSRPMCHPDSIRYIGWRHSLIDKLARVNVSAGYADMFPVATLVYAPITKRSTLIVRNADIKPKRPPLVLQPHLGGRTRKGSVAARGPERTLPQRWTRSKQYRILEKRSTQEADYIQKTTFT